MNPGLTEEVGQSTRTVIDALKSTPMILSILIFNTLFMGATLYAAISANERWRNLVETAMKYCLPAAGATGPS